MALTDLNRPKLKKYSHKGVSKKGGYVAKGQSRKISPSISNFGRSSNDPWLLAYREPGDLSDIPLEGDITKALENLTDIKTGLGVGRTKFLEDLLESETYKKKAAEINKVTKEKKYTRAEIIAQAKTQYRQELKNLKSAHTLVEQHRKSLFNEIAVEEAKSMIGYIEKRISDIQNGKLENLTPKDIPGLEKSLDSWIRKQQQAENRGIDLGGMFWDSDEKKLRFELQGVDKRFGEIFDTKGELGEFRKKLAEKFRKTLFDPNITIINVPKRHKPGVVNYIPTPGGVTDLDAMGFTKNMQLRESKFIGISGVSGDEKYKYPNTLKLNLGMPGNTNDDILEKSYFPGPPMGSEELHATGFTKFFTDKTKSQFVGISEEEDPKSYKYPVVVGPHQGTFRLGMKEGRTVTGLGNTDSSIVGVDYFSGEPGKWGNIGGESGTHTLPLGFWKNIGKEVSDLPWHSRSFLTRFSNKDGTGRRIFSLGPPTEADPTAWQLSSNLIIPGVPNTWDVHGQTMWNQMGEYPYAADTYPPLQSGVNFMAGTKKGKTFNPEEDLHPKGFTTNMGYIGTGVAAASKLAIPIDENGDITKLKISANLDGMDGYHFPYPGQGSWHIGGLTLEDQLQSGVNFMAGTKKGKGFLILGDLHPYGFTTNMGKINWDNDSDADPTTGIASRLAIPIDENGDRTKLKVSVPMGVTSTGAQEDANYDFPYPGQGSWYIGGLSLEDQLQSGVNFMYGAAKGKTVLDMINFETLHPKGFTPNMGKINWDKDSDADPNTGFASKLAIPIDRNGERGRLKISANLDGLDGYEFPVPGQGSWHIRKHWRRRSFQPTVSSDTEFYDLNVPDSQANYPIWSNMNIDATIKTATKASDSLNINEDSENITKLNTLIGASTYKVPRIGSEIARKFLHPTAIENSENKFSYIDHYWRWKKPEQIRDEAAPGKMTKDQIHPIIYKTLLDMDGENAETFRWSGATDRTQGSRATIEFIRGGALTSINRITADQHRLKTIMMHWDKKGWGFSAKQLLLQALNPRKETRVWNPLSIQAGATRVVKLQRHITAEGVWNTLVTSIFNPIQNWLDPGSVSPVTLGVYERYEGYDWSEKNRRGKKGPVKDSNNKLAQWANTSFPEIPAKSEEQGFFGSALDAVGRTLTNSFTSLASSLLGVNLDKSPDPPPRYVDSQKTLKGDTLLAEHVNSKFDEIGEKFIPGREREIQYPFKLIPQKNPREYVNLTEEEGYGGEGEGADRIGDLKYFDKVIDLDPQKRVDHVGHQGKPVLFSDVMNHPKLGRIHFRTSDQVDKINAHRYNEKLPEEGGLDGETVVNDFIKFRFKDMVKGSNIVFRAILSGINDNITPEWSSERYIGRADQVHVYKGADRNISFNFILAPKSKIELPILMEKLNYLIGLCYPDYDKNNSNRMVPPMTQLTIGSILDEAPGFLNSLSYTVEESSPWEIQEDLQFPKVLNVSCDFRYIGKNLPSKYGVHFGNKKSFYRDSLDIMDERPGFYTGSPWGRG